MDGENDKLKIVEFKREPAINSGLVSFLEQQLELAKTGELKMFAVAYVNENELGYRSFWEIVKYRQLSALVGQVSALHHNLNECLIASSTDVGDD